MTSVRIVSVLAAATMAGIVAGWIQPAPDDLIVMSIGQGDAAVLRHGGVTVMIDDGPSPRGSADPGSVIRNALNRVGVGHVDLILLSHPDADHVSGTPEVLREFPRARILMSSEFESMPKMQNDFSEWSVNPRSVVWLPEHATIAFAGCQLTIECPQENVDEDDNRGSMFVHVAEEGASADFSGDAPQDVEAEVANEPGWRADLLHVGHHGSKTATGESWLDKVRPRIAVISCGRGSPYGHPHRVVLDRLKAHGIAIERTDLQGDLRFVPRGGRFEPAS